MESDNRASSGNIPRIREIEARDNQEIARIIRQVLAEFGADRPGFAWQDPELDFMARAYEPDQRTYIVAESDDGLLGGAGFGEFGHEGAVRTCELQKMYMLPTARGLGLGKRMITRLLELAKIFGYQQCYLETLSSMNDARKLYLRTGFKLLSGPLGDSGHNACDEWYLLDLDSWEPKRDGNRESSKF